MSDYQLAQLNVSRLKAPLTDPMIKDFVDNLLPVNQEGEQSHGFVWRLQSESGYSSDIPFANDPMIVSNLTVWESLEALTNFAYRNSAHKAMMQRRKEWFEPHSQLPFPPLVLWWIEKDQYPTLEEAHQRLLLFREKGASPEAFDFRTPFPAP